MLKKYITTKKELDLVQTKADNAVKIAENTKNEVDKLKTTTESIAGQINDITSNRISMYTHNSNELVGSGLNGRFKSTSTGSFSEFIINGKTYSVVANDYKYIDLILDVWYIFVLDDTLNTINFSIGDGVPYSELATTTATTKHVASGKTFYSGDGSLKTGTAEFICKKYTVKQTKRVTSTEDVRFIFNFFDITTVACYRIISMSDNFRIKQISNTDNSVTMRVTPLESNVTLVCEIELYGY